MYSPMIPKNSVPYKLNMYCTYIHIRNIKIIYIYIYINTNVYIYIL